MAFGIGASFGKTGFNVVDVETTGLDSNLDRVIEIAVVHVDPNGTITDTWTSLINPGQDTGAQHVHGISNSMVEDAPRFEEIAAYLYDKLAALPLVAHNAKFDAAFITEELRRAGLHTFSDDFPRLDTIELAKLSLNLPNYKLETCCKHLDISLEHAHCALDDTIACAELFCALMKEDAQIDLIKKASLEAENMVWDVPDNIAEPKIKLRG